MTGKILLLAFTLGVAGVAGASETRAFPVFEPARLLDRTMPDAGFLPVGFKRHGMHRGFGGGHKGFHGRRFHKGFHGHRLHKRFDRPRFFAGKRLPHGSVFFGHRFVDPGFGLRFHHGDVFVKQRFARPGFFLGHRFGHRGDIVRQRFVGPGFHFGHRFGHRPFVLGRPSHHRLHR
jgi:hypothetical protein